MCKTNKLSIYLIKDGVNEPREILKRINQYVSIEGIGEFYYENSSVNSPSWVRNFFTNQLDENINLKSSSAKGVLLCSIIVDGKTITFVLSFGLGRHMIKKEAIEERFGLKVTLNTIDSSSIRSIEKNNIAALSKLSKDQMSKDSEVTEFGIDIEQDLVRAVTGKSKLLAFGNIIAGSDALSVSVKREIVNIIEFLELCYSQYQKTDYQEEFGWIDQIEELKDPVLIENLNGELLVKLNRRELDRIWMAVPELMDWADVRGFKYLPRQDDFSDDISLEEFLDSKNEEWESVHQLKSKTVRAFSASTDNEIDHWSVFKCIYGEIGIDEKLYIINNGKWYCVATDFVQKVNEAYNGIELSEIVLPDYEETSEGEYNIKVAREVEDVLCLDAQNITYGGGHSKIEFCDLFTSDLQMIHVKRYGGSSVLSHLFFQGVVSSELFISDPEFRQKLNEKLPDEWKYDNPLDRPIPSQYEVIYAIISKYDVDRPELPFFSKVSIKNAKRRIESYGYSVKLKKISISNN